MLSETPSGGALVAAPSARDHGLYADPERFRWAGSMEGLPEASASTEANAQKPVSEAPVSESAASAAALDDASEQDACEFT